MKKINAFTIFLLIAMFSTLIAADPICAAIVVNFLKYLDVLNPEELVEKSLDKVVVCNVWDKEVKLLKNATWKSKSDELINLVAFLKPPLYTLGNLALTNNTDIREILEEVTEHFRNETFFNTFITQNSTLEKTTLYIKMAASEPSNPSTGTYAGQLLEIFLLEDK